ncbi:MAG: 4-alpha-glucanotransferase [Alphaproteobacteria bacterium]|nr:4-alpha-glucanotransferase [Alphaproteobacteria bacterium]
MRTSGVLMHISSLPGDSGIGTFGENAYAFVDLLYESGQTYWQILPLCPTSFGDSPYQSFSTFAGNSYFIDLKTLENQGYLKAEEYADINWGSDPQRVDYGLLYSQRRKVFKKVQKHFFKRLPNDYHDFCRENAFWLDDFALFMAIKDEHSGKAFGEWESDIRKREPNAIAYYREKCKEQTDYYKMLQYLFFEQWNKLKNYANNLGIKIIGDLPIYVALDSSDVWSDPKEFLLNDEMQPIEVAGCPPDAFSENGQLWGNPLYDWEYMKNDHYSWWVKRIREALKLYDVVRIDHFRGFDSYYCVKAGNSTAKEGVWRKGPGMDLFNTLKAQLGKISIIAEDLGFLTDSVQKLLKRSKFPGMKVLQFAFDSREESDYLPHNYDKNCVVYTGTHDNDTVLGWQKSLQREDLRFAKQYLNCARNLNVAMIRCAHASVADTSIIAMQDILGLGGEARMNTPSTVGGNWQWRARKEDINSENFKMLRYLTKLYSRMRKD